MERMIHKKYNIETLGSKNVARVLRCLVHQPHMLRSVMEISNDLGISRSNVYRAVKSIEQLGLVIQIKDGKKKLYKTDISSRLAVKFFEIFTQERFMNLPSRLNNILSTFPQSVPGCDAMILFGSYANGLAHESSDIDICCVCENEEAKTKIKKLSRKYYPDFRFEIHFYNKQALENLNDFVILDSLLNGIPFVGADLVFHHLARIQNFPKAYMLYRLQKCEDYIKKINSVSGPAKKYFQDLVNISIGEINSVLKFKRTVPKKDIKKVNAVKAIEHLHDEISKRGDAIWLI